jgi:hypothetical protein
MKDASEIERQLYAKVLPTEDGLEVLTAFAKGNFQSTRDNRVWTKLKV